MSLPHIFNALHVANQQIVGGELGASDPASHGFGLGLLQIGGAFNYFGTHYEGSFYTITPGDPSLLVHSPVNNFMVHNNSGIAADNFAFKSGTTGSNGGRPIAAVPEPASIALFGAGLAGIAAFRRRRATV